MKSPFAPVLRALVPVSQASIQARGLCPPAPSGGARRVPTPRLASLGRASRGFLKRNTLEQHRPSKSRPAEPDGSPLPGSLRSAALRADSWRESLSRVKKRGAPWSAPHLLGPDPTPPTSPESPLRHRSSPALSWRASRSPHARFKTAAAPGLGAAAGRAAIRAAVAGSVSNHDRAAVRAARRIRLGLEADGRGAAAGELSDRRFHPGGFSRRDTVLGETHSTPLVGGQEAHAEEAEDVVGQRLRVGNLG